MSKARNIADSTKTLNIDGGTNTFIDLDKDDAGLSQVRFKNAGTLKFASWLNSDEDFIHYGTTGVAQIFYTGGTERMRITSSGSVGIGTSSPTHKAHILTTDSTPLSVEHSDGSDVYIKLVNNADGAGNFLGASSNNLTFWTENSERMRIDSSGRVAIGDTPKASFTGHSILQVGGQAILGANDALSTTGQTYLSHNLYFDTSGNYQVFNTGSANEGTVYTQADGIHKWSNSAATTGTPSVQERMRIDSSGNLIVGDTSAGGITTGGKFYATPSSGIYAAANADNAGYFNRNGGDGSIVEFRAGNATIGSIARASNTFQVIANAVSGTYNMLQLGASALNQQTYYLQWDAHNGGFYSLNDNTHDLGNPSNRWDDVYATNGTIQTSDRNEKQDIAELTDAEQRVAVAAKGLLRKFRWRDSVEAKGDEARTHFGIIAQDLQAAFAAEGLDAGDYAMFISSTWTDEETGEERTRMGVRYSELLAFIIAAI